MLLIATAVALGLLASRVVRPAAAHRAPHGLQWWPLLLAGVGGQLLAARLTGAAAIAVALTGLAALVVLALRNLAIAGTGVVALGLLCNWAAIAVNAGIPVRTDALVRVGVVEPGEIERGEVELTGPRRIEDASDPLPVLGDIIPVELTGQVVSFGDLVVAIGTACVVTDLTRRRRRPNRQPAPRPARAAAPVTRPTTEAVVVLGVRGS